VKATHDRLLGDWEKKAFATIRHKNVIHTMCKKTAIIEGKNIHNIRFNYVSCALSRLQFSLKSVVSTAILNEQDNLIEDIVNTIYPKNDFSINFEIYFYFIFLIDL